MMKRDGSQSKEMRGLTGYAREPQEFEPQLSWEFDKLVHWAKLVDGHGFKDQPFEKEVAQEAAKHYSRGITKESFLRQAKQELYKRIFFRVADPKYKLPTRTRFEQYYKTTVGENDAVPAKVVESQPSASV